MNDKHFIIGKTQTKEEDHFEELPEEENQEMPIEDEHHLLRECTKFQKQKGGVKVTYFNLYGLMRKLFQKKGNAYIGRFTEKANISCSNLVVDDTNKVSLICFEIKVFVIIETGGRG